MRRKIGGTHHKTAKKVTRHHRRHRRISGANDIGGALQSAGGVIVGSIAARELNTLLVKFMPTLSPMLSGVIQMATGFVLPKMVKGSSFVDNVGKGMIANGGMVLVVSTGMISGVSSRMAYKINGTSHLQVINGTGNLPVVNGPNTRISNTPTNSSRYTGGLGSGGPAPRIKPRYAHYV
jgi:hypothetical protein